MLSAVCNSQFIERFGKPGTDPFGWGLTTLGECCELNPRKPKDMNTNIDYSFVAMPSVSEDGRIDSSIERPYSEVCKGFTYFGENDVLFAKITPCMENGKGGVAKKLKNGAGFGSTEFHVLRPIKGISDPYWIYILTIFPKFRSDAEKVMTGTGGQRRVPITYLNEYPIALPPIDLQEQFAAFVRQSDKSQFMELFGDPVTNTQGREVRPFKDFMLDIRYGTSQPPTFNELGEFKFIRATNIKAGRITENGMLRISADEAAKIEKCRLNGNEIIIVRSGANTGDTCVVTDEYRDQYAGYDIIVTLNLEIANPVFFNELMNTHYMQAIIKPLTVRAAQPHINSEQVQNLPMLVVPLQEQEQFATFVRQSDKSKLLISRLKEFILMGYRGHGKM